MLEKYEIKFIDVDGAQNVNGGASALTADTYKCIYTHSNNYYVIWLLNRVNSG